MRHIDIVACELRTNGKPANTSQRIELFLAHPTYKHGLRSKCPTRLARVLNVLAGCLPCWPISPSADFSRLEFGHARTRERKREGQYGVARAQDEGMAPPRILSPERVQGRRHVAPSRGLMVAPSIMAGHSGYPKFSGRVVRVLGISGFQK